jgi:ribosomal-protein-alanine N-acetyltransferase
MNLNFTPFPELTTERLHMRQISLSDDREIFFQRSDKSMNQYVSNPLCQSIEEAREWIDKISRGIANNEWIFWGICLKGQSKLAGGFCFWNVSAADNKAEIGFGIYPQHQRKGLMDEALKTAVQYGFKTMGLQCIEAYTHPQNSPSIHVLEKNGFRLKEQQPEDPTYIAFELFAGTVTGAAGS